MTERDPALEPGSINDHELFPDAISVIGAPEAGDGLVMEYFDSRSVRRKYGISLDDGVLRRPARRLSQSDALVTCWRTAHASCSCATNCRHSGPVMAAWCALAGDERAPHTTEEGTNP